MSNPLARHKAPAEGLMARVLIATGIGILSMVNSLQQKLILNYWNWKSTIPLWLRNETGRTVEGMKFVCQREDQEITKPVWRNEKYKKRVYSLLWREGSKKVEKSETESSVSMQGRRFYRQSFEERPLSGLEVIRQNIAAQIQIKCIR